MVRQDRGIMLRTNKAVSIIFYYTLLKRFDIGRINRQSKEVFFFSNKQKLDTSKIDDASWSFVCIEVAGNIATPHM